MTSAVMLTKLERRPAAVKTIAKGEDAGNGPRRGMAGSLSALFSQLPGMLLPRSDDCVLLNP